MPSSASATRVRQTPPSPGASVTASGVPQPTTLIYTTHPVPRSSSATTIHSTPLLLILSSQPSHHLSSGLFPRLVPHPSGPSRGREARGAAASSPSRGRKGIKEGCKRRLLHLPPRRVVEAHLCYRCTILRYGLAQCFFHALARTAVHASGAVGTLGCSTKRFANCVEGIHVDSLPALHVSQGFEEMTSLELFTSRIMTWCQCPPPPPT